MGDDAAHRVTQRRLSGSMSAVAMLRESARSASWICSRTVSHIALKSCRERKESFWTLRRARGNIASSCSQLLSDVTQAKQTRLLLHLRECLFVLFSAFPQTHEQEESFKCEKRTFACH